MKKVFTEEEKMEIRKIYHSIELKCCDLWYQRKHHAIFYWETYIPNNGLPSSMQRDLQALPQHPKCDMLIDFCPECGKKLKESK